MKGLMYLAIHDMQAIRSVIDTLRIPSLETRVGLPLNTKPEDGNLTLRNIGNYTGYVLRITQYQDFRLVQDIHCWSKTNE